MDQKDLTEIDSLCDQAMLLSYKDLQQAELMAEECLDRAELVQYEKGIMNARLTLCALEIYRGNMDLAREKLSHIEQELVTEASTDENLMRYSQVRGLYFLNDGNYRDAFDSFIRSGVIAARVGNILFQGLCDNGKGCIKLDQQEYQDAYEYFKNASRIFRNYDKEILHTLVSLNLGCALRGLGRQDEALDILTKTLERTVREEWGILECAILDEMGRIMLEKGDLDHARRYIDEGLEKSRRLGEHDIHMSLVYEKARLMMQEGQPAQAEKLLSDFSSEHHRDLHRFAYYQLLADIQELQGNYKKALRNYKILHDSQQKTSGTDVTLSILKQENKILQEANHQLRLISTIGQELVANLDIGRILNLIYAQMNVLMPVDLLIVALVDNNDIKVKFSLKNGLRLKPVTIHKEDETSLLAWSVRNKKEILIRDGLREYAEYVSAMVPHEELHQEDPMLSVICIPLWYINEIVGVISVQCGRKNAYTNRDLENLRALGSYAGIAIRNALQTERMNELNEILKRRSATDSLTGLVNRREMLHQAKSIWRVCRRNKFWVSLIMIDLDHFKKVNDQHGHSAGDTVLKRFGGLLNRYFKRALDCACRYGGEELMVITGDMHPREAAARIELMREEVSQITFKGKEDRSFQVQFSCGIYGEIPREDVSKRLTRITGIVDTYLYEAKGNGRNRTYLSDDVKKPAEQFILRSRG